MMGGSCSDLCLENLCLIQSSRYQKAQRYWTVLLAVLLSGGKREKRMVVYHVCSSNKLRKYQQEGAISPPVRAWENIEQAERFSKSTGRRIILRLKFPGNAKKLDGHFNQARVLHRKYILDSI